MDGQHHQKDSSKSLTVRKKNEFFR